MVQYQGMNPAIATAIAHSIIWSPNRLAPFSLICSFVTKNHNSCNQAERYLCRRQLSTISMNSSMADGNGATSESILGRDHPGVGTQYRVSCTSNNGQKNKWVSISFDASDDMTSPQNATTTKKQKVVGKIINENNNNNKGSLQEWMKEQETKNDTNCKDPSQQSSIPGIPESVLQYQRQMRKIQAADRASKTNVNIEEHLHTVYSDEHVVVTNKPSGILCVPGVNKNRSLLDLVYEVYGSSDTKTNDHDEQSTSTATPLPRDSMVVHRLDMDTSGIVIFARTRTAMSKLHESFRERTGTKKIYEALLVGHLDINRWVEYAGTTSDSTKMSAEETDDKGGKGKSTMSSEASETLGGGEINLPLQRDHRHPPFMRVSTPESEAAARQAVKDLNHAGYKKLIAKKPKPSTTQFRVLSHEGWMGHPVTRVDLTPITGRTHQLRVHCAAIGHPILGDPAYGFFGEAHPNGGFSDAVIRQMSPTCASFELRRNVEDLIRESGRTMCLHARRLTVDHPITNEKVTFEAAPSF